MKARISWVVAVLVLTLSVAARGATCPVPSGASAELASISGEERLTFIQGRLRSSAHDARLWTWSWLAVNGALLVGQVVAVPLVAPEERPDWVVGASTAGLAVAAGLAFPLTVRWSQPELDERVARGAEDVCVVLADAERMLFADADNQAGGVSIWMHLVNVGVGLAAGLVLGLGYRHWVPGALVNGLGAIALGEAQLLTQPTRLVKDAQAYRAGQLRPAAATAGVMLTPWRSPSSTDEGLVLSIAGRF